MGAQNGKDLLIKIDMTSDGQFETIAGLRATRVSFNAEFAAGAAGGGGVDVGGGAIIQPQLGLTWRLNHQLAARLEAGRVKALGGKLDSNLIGLGVIYEFSRPEYHY